MTDTNRRFFSADVRMPDGQRHPSNRPARLRISDSRPLPCRRVLRSDRRTRRGRIEAGLQPAHRIGLRALQRRRPMVGDAADLNAPLNRLREGASTATGNRKWWKVRAWPFHDIRNCE